MSAKSLISAFSVLSACLAGGVAPALAANEGVTPTGTVHGVKVSEHRLAVVQLCDAAGQNCRTGFADVRRDDEDPAALVTSRQPQSAEPPVAQTLIICGASWVAAVHSSHGHSLVCGYPSEKAALSAALEACDIQSGGACRQSGELRVSWGRWEGEAPAGEGDGHWYQDWPQGRSCESTLPLQVSSSCGADVVEVLRGVQVR